MKNLEELAELQAKQKEIIKKEAEGIKEPEVPLHKGVTYKTYSTSVLKSNKKFKVFMTCFIFIQWHRRMNFAQYFLVAVVRVKSNENQLHNQQQIFVLFNILYKAFRKSINHNAYNFRCKFKWAFNHISTKIEFRWFPSNVGFLRPFCWFQFEPRNGLIWVRKCPRFDWQLFWLEFSTPKFQRLVLLDSISNLRQSFCSLTFLWWICEANFIWLYLGCAPVAV